MTLSEIPDSLNLLATIQQDGVERQYECLTFTCKNPVCRCGAIKLELYDYIPENSPLSPTKPGKSYMEIKLKERVLGRTDPEFDPLAQSLFDQLTQDDYVLLMRYYLAYKKIFTMAANPDDFKVDFPHQAIEYDKDLFPYIDAVPYDEELTVISGSRKYLLEDHYCLATDCGCTEVHLEILDMENLKEVFASAKVDYSKQKATLDRENNTDVARNIIASGIEKEIRENLPLLCKKLRSRHADLKQIYFNYLKREGLISAPASRAGAKIGRNDPCPCGSGKKYKKCCLGKM